MSVSRPRRIALGDALILIAVLSLALASLRTTWSLGPAGIFAGGGDTAAFMGLQNRLSF